MNELDVFDLLIPSNVYINLFKPLVGQESTAAQGFVNLYKQCPLKNPTKNSAFILLSCQQFSILVFENLPIIKITNIHTSFYITSLKIYILFYLYSY